MVFRAKLRFQIPPVRYQSFLIPFLKENSEIEIIHEFPLKFQTFELYCEHVIIFGQVDDVIAEVLQIRVVYVEIVEIYTLVRVPCDLVDSVDQGQQR
jgi:hypothetical protein